MADLRDFRRRVSLLKKQGLISSRIDARKATPTSKSKGKRLDSLVEKFDAVASGKAKAVELPTKEVAKFKKAGYETSGNRVIIPHSAVETVQVKRGQVSIIHKSGMERVQIPCEYRNLEQYLQCIKDHAKKLNKLKASNEYWGFKFFGNNSTRFYRYIEDAIDDLRSYQSVLSASSRVKQQNVYKNIELFRLTPKTAREWEHVSAEKKRSRSKKYNRLAAKRFRGKLRKKPKHIKEHYKQIAAEASKRYRAKLKGKKLKAYKEDAKKRAAKSKRKTKRSKRKK